MFSGIAVMCFTDPDLIMSVMLGGAADAVNFAVKLIAVYAVWLSVLKILERTGLSKKINRLFLPLNKRLFKGESDEAYEYITLNLTANLLGTGSAATPMGIKAIESMNGGKEQKAATDNQILFIVINCTSIQLIPGAIIALRAAAGAATAADIILPSLLATVVSTILGVVACKCLAGLKLTKKRLPNK